MFAEKLDLKQAIFMKAKAALQHQKQSQAALHRQQDATENDLKSMWAALSIVGRRCTASNSKGTQAACGHNRCICKYIPGKLCVGMRWQDQKVERRRKSQCAAQQRSCRAASRASSSGAASQGECCTIPHPTAGMLLREQTEKKLMQIRIHTLHVGTACGQEPRGSQTRSPEVT